MSATGRRIALCVLGFAVWRSEGHGRARADAPVGRYATVDCDGTPCVKDALTGLF